MKFTLKVTSNHLLVKGTERQNVHEAVEFLSGTVAAAIGYLLPGQGHVVKLVQTVNAGFDVLNSRMLHHPTNKVKSGYGTYLEDQDEALN